MLIKKPEYHSRNNDHVTAGTANFRQNKVVFFLKTTQVVSAAHSAAFSIFTGFSLP